MIHDQMLPDDGVGVIGGTGLPGGGDGGGHFFDGFIGSGPEPPKPPETVRPAERPKPAEAPAIERHRVGGVVREPKLIYRIDPRYPDLAKHAGISGVVKLTGVIGIDGRIRELSVVTGNPLLTPAALAAVRQWVYQPTLLNGDPIEVETEIVVTFTLSR
jgi:protein TonB